jgi:3-deoxy-D-manno-octulosonate 8-phosphate phosphatase (KDO 8-P phosphatase)
MQDIQQKAKSIRLIIFDVDGVLTDGSLFIGDDGQEYKAFNS